MTYKKLKTVTFSITLANGKNQDIKLPANYQVIFDSVMNGIAGCATAKLYDIFVSEYSCFSEYEKEKYQHIANSGRVRTDDMCDLVNIFDVMDEYFSIDNISSLVELGRMYATLQQLEYVGDKSESNMDLRYAELGQAVCDMHKGFFVDNRFYGLMADSDE